MILGEGAAGHPPVSVRAAPGVAHSVPADATRAHSSWRAVATGISSVLVALLTAVLVILAVDWLLFDTPILAAHWQFGDYNGSPADKLVLANRHLDSAVVYLGDSRVLRGIDPEVVSRECRCGPGFNAGFPAAEPRLSWLMADRLLTKLSPSLVVISVSQWELSDAANISVGGPTRELVRPWQLEQFGFEVSDPTEAQLALGTVWRLYNYRLDLRTTLEGWAARVPPTDLRRGFIPEQGADRVDDRDVNRGEDRFFDDFTVRGRRARELQGMIADLRQRGIRVLLVAPPLHPDLLEEVERRVITYQRALQQLANESGVPFEDLTVPKRSGLKADHFSDIVHLTAEGAERYSRQVGKAITTRLGPG